MKPARMKQLPLLLGPGPAQSFDSFILGGNAAAVAALRAEPGPATCYVWGPVGSGKSHLLRACARAAQAAGRRASAFDATEPLPWAWDDDCRLLLLDACEAYDAARQHAAFTLFVEAATSGVPVVAAGRLPPVDLPLREDLRTRLAGGPVFQLAPLSEAEARGALQREAGRRGIELADEVVDYVLTRFARDLGSLMALLEALDEFSLAEQRAVTVPLLRQMLARPPIREQAS